LTQAPEGATPPLCTPYYGEPSWRQTLVTSVVLSTICGPVPSLIRLPPA